MSRSSICMASSWDGGVVFHERKSVPDGCRSRRHLRPTQARKDPSRPATLAPREGSPTFARVGRGRGVVGLDHRVVPAATWANVGEGAGRFVLRWVLARGTPGPVAFVLCAPL